MCNLMTEFLKSIKHLPVDRDRLMISVKVEWLNSRNVSFNKVVSCLWSSQYDIRHIGYTMRDGKRRFCQQMKWSLQQMDVKGKWWRRLVGPINGFQKCQDLMYFSSTIRKRVVHKRCPQRGIEGFSQMRSPADMRGKGSCRRPQASTFLLFQYILRTLSVGDVYV